MQAGRCSELTPLWISLFGHLYFAGSAQILYGSTEKNRRASLVPLVRSSSGSPKRSNRRTADIGNREMLMSSGWFGKAMDLGNNERRMLKGMLSKPNDEWTLEKLLEVTDWADQVHVAGAGKGLE